MAKLTLNDVTSGYASTTLVNANNTLTETALENTLSRDGTGPNQMEANLDMNGYRILNQANPITVSGLVWEGPWVTGTTYQVGDIVETGGTSYIAITAHTASALFASDLANWQVVVTAVYPDQAGQANKFLQTNGTSPSWQVPDASEVSFTQSGTGAVARTALAKMRESFSTPDYSAAVDGATDDSTPLANAIAVRLGGTVKLPVGTSLVGDVQNDGVSIRGDGYGSILKAKAAATTVMKLGHVSTPSQWAKRRIVDAMIDGNTKASNGLTLSATASTEIAGRWVVEDSVIKACAKGVYKPAGNIGNAFRGVNFTGNDYGIFAVSQAAPIMHAGNDLFEDCEFSGNALAAIYYDSSVIGTGGVQIRNNTVIENNAGFGIFVKNWKTSYTPFLMDGVWFEANATSPSVTIEGVAYTPVDVYLENCDLAVFQNGKVPSVKLVNSKITLDRSFLSEGSSAITADATSTVTITNAHTDGGLYAFEIQSLANANRAAGNFALRCLAPPRSEKSHDQTGLLQSITFANADTYLFSGTGSVNATTVADGRIFDSCAELTIPASYTLVQTSFTITTGKWYVFTLDAKHISGTKAELSITVVDATALSNDLSTLLTTGEWGTVASIGKAEATGTVQLRLVNGVTGAQVVRFSAMQTVEFDDEQSAINYYNNREYKMPHDLPRVIHSTVPPTTGTWAVKDICWNTAPAAAGTPGWVCTTAGTPGTWKAMAVVAA